jgi:shikimate kinase
MRVLGSLINHQEALSRVGGDGGCPLLKRSDLDEVYQRRLPVYEDLSVFTVDTAGRHPDAIAREVLAELTRLPPPPEENLSS